MRRRDFLAAQAAAMLTREIPIFVGGLQLLPRAVSTLRRKTERPGDVNGIDWHQWPADMRNIGELPHLTAELLRRGYTERRLRLLYAENWRRVFADTMP